MRWSWAEFEAVPVSVLTVLLDELQRESESRD
jgi:hypothetical protein